MGGVVSDIRIRLEQIRQRMMAACAAAGRDPASVRLLAASKGASVAQIRQAVAAGQRCFGENYVQEGLAKIVDLQDCTDLEWHFIGPIQRNKTQAISRAFDWVQGVDRALIAERLDQQRAGLPPLNVLIQVNISAEASKSGVLPAQIPALAEAICALPQLRLRGLMALPSADSGLVEIQCREVAACFTALRQSRPEQLIDTLSMGMSADLESAIAAGATLLRVGTAIFGNRRQKSEVRGQNSE